jgi:hypothetical protein
MPPCASITSMSRALAWIIAAGAVTTAIAAVVVNLIADGRGAPNSLDSASAGLFVISVAAPASVGLFVALRQPGNRVAWTLLLGPLSVAVVMCADAVAHLALHDDPGSATAAWALLVAQQWPVLFLWPLALAYVFPDGRLPSPRWRPVARLVWLACGGLVTMLLFVPDLEARAQARERLSKGLGSLDDTSIIDISSGPWSSGHPATSHSLHSSTRRCTATESCAAPPSSVTGRSACRPARCTRYWNAPSPTGSS